MPSIHETAVEKLLDDRDDHRGPEHMHPEHEPARHAGIVFVQAHVLAFLDDLVG